MYLNSRRLWVIKFVSPLPFEELSLQVPEAVLQQRVINKGQRTVTQALIRWSSTPDSMTTWEDVEALKHRFPAGSAWG
jgi:hypothetical protein